MAVDMQRINNTLGKMSYLLGTHNSISVGVSGGSDSNIIVHIIATYFREYLPKVHFVFCNTGLEYRATLRHLEYMEQRYNIHIDRIRGESVVKVAREKGVPILSKGFSQTVSKARQGAPSAWKKINGLMEEHNGKKSRFNFSPKQSRLANYIIENDINVSDKCCDLSKKKPNKKYLKENRCDLVVSGERKVEGGQRANAHTDCFEPGNEKKIDKYMPLWHWDDETKQYYKEHEGIIYSDCYEVWGMKRTGCVGCPFNSRVGEELKIIKKYEPQLYSACINVFGESYKLMDEFEVHRHKIFDEQLTFEEV